MKKILFLFFALNVLQKAKSQQGLVIQFSSQGTIPAITFNSSDSTYTVVSNDTGFNNRIASYTIKIFGKMFPTVHIENHSKAEALDRYYLIQTVQNVSTLYNSLVSYQSPIVSELYIRNPSVSLFTPNDYGLVNTPFCNGTNPNSGSELSYIKAEQAWDITQGSNSIIIGIVDIGFDPVHEDIVNKVLPSNYTFGTSYGYHGNEVAGVAAAETNNNKGMASIGNKSMIKFYDMTLYPNQHLLNLPQIAYSNMLIAAQSNCKVINCSWRDYDCQYYQYEQDIIDIIHDNYKAVIVAGAGNGVLYTHCGGPSNGNGLAYPASYNHVISATAVGHKFEKNTYYSCFDPSLQIGFGWKDYHDSYSNARTVSGSYNPPLLAYTSTHNSGVDLCAPGYAVTSLNPNNSYKYEYYSGTSYSSPMIAGTAALIFSVNPNFTADDVQGILRCSARDMYGIPENYPYLNQLGSGALDAGKALQLAQTWVPNTGFTMPAAPLDIRWFDVLSDGTITVEEEVTCLSTQNPGKCNVGYRIEAVGPGSGQNLKWLVYYLVNGLPVTYSEKFGTSVVLTRGVDYPATNNSNGVLSVAVRIDGCPHSIYYKEDRANSCIDPSCSYPCNSNLTITGNYSTAITESSTWIKSSGQTTISAINNVKLDAKNTSGYVEIAPASNTDYFISSPSTSLGVFVAQALDGCGGGVPARPSLINQLVKNNELAEKISVYPNPAKNLFKIRAPFNLHNLKVQVFDASGKAQNVRISISGNVIEVNCSGLSSGVYLVKMLNNSVNRVVKLSLQ